MKTKIYFNVQSYEILRIYKATLSEKLKYLFTPTLLSKAYQLTVNFRLNKLCLYCFTVITYIC